MCILIFVYSTRAKRFIHQTTLCRILKNIEHLKNGMLNSINTSRAYLHCISRKYFKMYKLDKRKVIRNFWENHVYKNYYNYKKLINMYSILSQAVLLHVIDIDVIIYYLFFKVLLYIKGRGWHAVLSCCRWNGDQSPKTVWAWIPFHLVWPSSENPLNRTKASYHFIKSRRAKV